MRLLLVEDNSRLAHFVKTNLTGQGFTVDAFETAGDATAALDTATYDAVVLDLELPDADGASVLRHLRGRGRTIPVLILTARDDVSDRVAGLNAGADDYLAKPFAIEELVARLRALLRRPGSALGRELALGNVRFDSQTREVRVDGVPLPLPRRELDLLELFLRRAGRVVAKTEIESSLYGFDDEIASNSVEVGIHRLRKRLSDAGASPAITTLRGVGYLLSDGRRE
jgi:DNA-binding response OmpR family regulator